jgi:hypothetical protein
MRGSWRRRGLLRLSIEGGLDRIDQDWMPLVLLPSAAILIRESILLLVSRYR